MLGNVRESAGDEVRLARPAGRPARRDRRQGRSQVTSADGRRPRRVPRSPQGTFVYNEAETTGLYHARWEPDGLLPFAVNLFDFRESDLAPRGLVPEGVPDEPGRGLQDQDRLQPRRRHPGAPGRAARTGGCRSPSLALGVVLVEWYIYNRRVYV